MSIDTKSTRAASGPATENSTPVGTAQRLSGSLGPVAIVLMVLAAASPLGVIGGNVPLALGFGNGAGLPSIYLVSTLILLLFAVGFTSMTPFVRSAGAFYSYVDTGLGRHLGVGAAIVALFSYLALGVGLYGLFGPALSGLIASYGGPEIPWWISAFVCLTGVTLLGHRHIDLSGKVLGVLLFAEVIIVAVLDAVIVFNGGPEGPSAEFMNPMNVLEGAPGVALVFAILGFIGFEATVIFRDEARDPDRTIPKATYFSLILIGLFYAFTSWALVTGSGPGAVKGAAAGDPEAFLPGLFEVYLGSGAVHIMQFLYVTSLFASVLSFHNIVARYLFSMGSKGVLPKPLAKPHTKHGSPYIGSLVGTAFMVTVLAIAAVLAWDPILVLYSWFAGFTSLGIMFLVVLTSVAILVFFAKTKTNLNPWKTRIAPALGLVGSLGALLLIMNNMAMLVGDETGWTNALIVLLFASFVGGIGLARARKNLSVS